MKFLKLLDRSLNRLTMYRSTLLYLIFLVAAAIGLSTAGILHYDPAGLAFSAGYLALICAAVNWVFAKTFATSTNPDSSYITGLILALIITPMTGPRDIAFFTAAAGLAIASKYLLAISAKHLFNPAAAGVMLTALGAGQSASWWVGSAPMLPFVLVGGLLLIRGLRKWGMVLTFLSVGLLTAGVLGLAGGSSLWQVLQQTLLSTALVFLAFIMLTEPQTAPRTYRRQLWYAAMVGALFAPQIHLGPVYSTPELALILGNVFTWLVSPRYSARLRLASKHQLSSNILDYVFTPVALPPYLPGQYMDWTLPHSALDARGDRRMFTLASSPTEPELRIAVKFASHHSSSYKRALHGLDIGDLITANQLAGDFVLPTDPKLKIAFIAGGVGVTPFRSMVKYLIDTHGDRDITMLYAERRPVDLIYTDVFEAARAQLGLTSTYFITAGGEAVLGPHQRSGRITAAAISSEIPDYLQRRFYVSGPTVMVAAVSSLLRELGIPAAHIKTDYFTGYENL